MIKIKLSQNIINQFSSQKLKMSMIEKLQKISAQMFQQMLKTYQMKDVIVHQRAHAINALQYCSLYPNKGVGFKIRRRTWPKGMHYLLKQAHYKSNRFGHFIGLKFDQNGQADEYPKRLQGLNKRGVWEYDLGDFEQFTTDNGVKYTRADYEAYFNVRAPKQTSSAEEVVQQNLQQLERQQEQGVEVPGVGFSPKSE